MLRDRLAECLSLLAVLQGQLERPLRDPHPARRDVDPADLERVHHLREALAETGLLAAEDPLRRALVARVDELRGLDALVAHLLDLRRNLETRELALVGLLP